jgi:hypothetical protein
VLEQVECFQGVFHFLLCHRQLHHYVLAWCVHASSTGYCGTHSSSRPVEHLPVSKFTLC